MNKSEWARYNMVRIYLVAKDLPGCARLIDKLPSCEIDPVIEEFRASLERNLEQDNRDVYELVQSIDQCEPETLGKCLSAHYRKTKLPNPASTDSVFPIRYIFLHDAHHVLLGSDVTPQGELEVIAFEGGLIGSDRADALMPLLTQLMAFQGCDIDYVRIARAWEIGCKTSKDLLEFWQIENDLNQSVERLRHAYNIGSI
ncbi:MAG: hypothetical protein SNJ57_18795 [Cyanobacteriota bacterium]